MTYPSDVPSYLVSVFAQENVQNGGNPCPIYILTDPKYTDKIDSEKMRSIAASFNHESCFVLPPDDPSKHDYKFRFFVPNHEMEMCGHATLGTAKLLKELDIFKPQNHNNVLKVQTLSGTVHAYYNTDGQVEITQPQAKFVNKLACDMSQLSQALGVPKDDFTGFVANSCTSRTKTLVEIKSSLSLNSIVPQVDIIAKFCKDVDSTGIYAYSVEDQQDKSKAIVVNARQFPCNAGYPEDPATGIAAAALFYGLDAPTQGILIHQGVAMGRPSEIRVRKDPSGDNSCRLSGLVSSIPYSSLVYTNPNARSYRLDLDPPLDSETIKAAQTRILPGFEPTPLIELPSVAQELGLDHVFLKDESQRAELPAFKILGASWAIFNVLFQKFNLDPKTTSLQDLRDAIHKDKNAPLLHFFAATDGNHGRAVARVGAKLLGCKASIYVPHVVSERSQQLIASEGAKVHISQGDYDFAVEQAAKAAENEGSHGIIIQDSSWEGYEYIPKVIEYGYTTIFSEIDAELSNRGLGPVSLVCLPVGVGCLAHGCVQYYHSKQRSHEPPKIITAEPDTAACLLTSLLRGTNTTVQTKNTIMPGLNCGTVSPTAFPNLSKCIDQSVAVSDDQCVKALRTLKSLGMTSGPCGSAAFAALRRLKQLNIPLLEKSTSTSPSIAVMICTESNLTSQIE